MAATSVFCPKHGSQLCLPPPNKLFLSSTLFCFPLMSFPSKPAKFVHLKATTTPRTFECDDHQSNRTFQKLLPSPWTDQFHSVSVDVSEMDALMEDMDALKPKVKKALMPSPGIASTKKRILMIYLLVSLGIAHHFEDEIYETLKEDFEKIEKMMAGEEDLYTVSIIFWVFRRYGHHISSDVFRKFKNNNGNFEESLLGDAKGMLSLFEAAHLRTTKDSILDEALIFTSSHLESLALGGTCPPHLSARILSALTLPQHWNMEMLVPVEYITFYEQEKNHDEMLLKFSKLNFKLLQLEYLRELKVATKWYKEIDVTSKLPPYFRDRVVENHFFIQSVLFEQQLSAGRIMLIKYFTILGFIDDTFDRYASLSEATSLANSLERWAPDHALDKQPDYIKFLFNFIVDTFKELESELSLEGRSDSVKSTIKEIKTDVKANFELAKWAHTAHIPSFESYMQVGGVEITVYATLAGTFMSMGKMATSECYEWLTSRPKLVQAVVVRGRLMNDLAGFEDDMNRGSVINAVNCYMNQYGVTRQEAFTELLKMVTNAEKIINEELLKTIGVPRLVLKAAIRVAQMITLSFNNGYDGYTFPEEKINEYMTSMFVDQVRI